MKVEFKDKQSNGDFPRDGAYEVLRMHVRMKDPTTEMGQCRGLWSWLQCVCS